MRILALLIALLIGGGAQAQMMTLGAGSSGKVSGGGATVAIDALPSPVDCHAAAGTSISCSPITVGARSNGALIALLAIGNGGGVSTIPTGVSCSWGAQSMTQVPGASDSQQLGGTRVASSFIFSLLAPNTGAQTLSCSWTSTQEAYVSAVSFYNVNQSGGATSFPNGTGVGNSSTSPSITLTGPTNGYVIGTSTYFNTGSAVSGTTLFRDETGTFPNGLSNYATSSGISATLSFTQASSVQWSYAATGISP